MGDFEAAFEASVARAVTPTAADLIVGRAQVIAALRDAGASMSLEDLEDAWLETKGLRRADIPRFYFARNDPNQARTGRRHLDADPDDPYLLRCKATRIVRMVLGELRAQGIVAGTPGPEVERIEVHREGMQSSVALTPETPKLGGAATRFMLIRMDPTADPLLSEEQMTEGLEDLLGLRGLRCVHESRRSLRRGVYLAAVSLLAAASEAAWFNLARRVGKPELIRKLDETPTAKFVIQQTELRLRELKLAKATLTEVLAGAHMFRDIRNYALHPVREHDQDLETWLTEPGATVLTMSSRRYFVKLADIMGEASARI